MGHRFLSPEWLEAGRRILAESPEFRKAIAGASASILTVVTDAPDGRPHFVYQEFRDGAVHRMEGGTNGAFAGRTAEFTVTASYLTLQRLQQGTLGLQAAYFQRLVRLSGDLQKALRFAPAFVKYSELVRRVETEY